MTKQYVHMIVQGSPDLIKGFVTGFLAGKGLQEQLFFFSDNLIDVESTFGKILRKIGAKEDQIHFLVDESISGAITEGITRAESLPIKVISVKKIIDALFPFSFQTFSRPTAEKLKNILRELPPGVRQEGYLEKEKVNSEAKGIELYTPDHEFTFKASGKIHGQVMEVIDFQRTLQNQEFVTVGEITLMYDDGTT
jgi:hypothetical protein